MFFINKAITLFSFLFIEVNDKGDDIPKSRSNLAEETKIYIWTLFTFINGLGAFFVLNKCKIAFSTYLN